MRDRVDRETAMQYFAEIFEGFYMMYIKQMYTYNDFDYNVKGVLYTGDNDIDEADAERYVLVPMTIADIAEKHAEGVKCYFKYGESVEKVFQHVKNYNELITGIIERNFVGQRRIGNDETWMTVLSELQMLVSYANTLRGAISFNAGVEFMQVSERPKPASTKISHLLQQQLHPEEEVSLDSAFTPDKLKVNATLPSHMKYATVGRKWTVDPPKKQGEVYELYDRTSSL